MKRKKGLRSLTVLLSLLTFLSPAYLCYFALVETNLFAADMSYESPDQDGLSMNLQSEFRGFAATVPSFSLFSTDNLFKWLHDFSYQVLSIVQRSFVLRC